jgi:50S ribosomal subunit-associated GTPase HflX
LKGALKKMGMQAYAVSALKGKGLDALKEALEKRLFPE